MTDQDIITNMNSVRISGYMLLTKRGKALYIQKCRELFKDGELRKSYLQSLLTWADCYDRYWELRSQVDKEGVTFITHNRGGEAVHNANPKVKMMNDALKQANAILSEFGATLKQARKLGKEKPAKTKLDDWED